MTPADADRLWRLLPAVYRQRDAEGGGPLRALLGIVAEQVDLISADIDRLYDNWFIETCDDWVVPYLGDLLGYRKPDTGAEGSAPGGRVVPRRDVADTLHFRRRKGTAGLLDEMAASVSGWPCRVVEFDRLLSATQSVKHLRPTQGRTAELRDPHAMGRLGTAFDATAHSVDVRRPQSNRTIGRHGLTSVGLFVWRLRVFPVTRMPAYRDDHEEVASFTFSVLGNTCPLFVAPPAGATFADATPVGSLEAHELPGPLTRAALADASGHVSAAYYGEGRSLAIWRLDEGRARLLPREDIVVADLSTWQPAPAGAAVAVDPETGRLVFSAATAPEHGLEVSYHHAFSDATGGGEYARTATRRVAGTRVYRVARSARDGACGSLDDALSRWRAERPANAVIELMANAVHADPQAIVLAENQSLEIRAARGTRPLIDLRNRHVSGRDHLGISGAANSRFALTGLLVAGRGLELRGQLAGLTIRHCTLVPGWKAHDAAEAAGDDARGKRRDEAVPSLRLNKVATRVVIDRSIVGAISVVARDPVQAPLSITLTDSIVDATSSTRTALDAPGRTPARARLTIRRCTVIGQVRVGEIALAENTLFDGELQVDRHQSGCLRHCWVEPGSFTPQRHACQPDAAIGTLRGAEANALAARLKPRFNSRRYGRPAYLQLADACADEIRSGADDNSEMGAFHDLYESRRLADLRARIDDSVPADRGVGIFKET